MSTVIDSLGRMKGYWAGSCVLGPYSAYRRLIGCKVKRTTTMDASGGITISWQTVIYDTDKFFASGTPTYLKAPMDGWYAMIAYLNTAVTTAHMGRLALLINGVETAIDRVNFTDVAAIKNGLNIAISRYWLNAGDQVSVTWDSGGVVIGLDTSGESGCTLSLWRTA